MNSKWIFPSFFFISLWWSQERVQVAKDELANWHVLLPWQHIVRQRSYQLHDRLGAVLSSHRSSPEGDSTRLFFSSLILPHYLVSNIVLLCLELFCNSALILIFSPYSFIAVCPCPFLFGATLPLSQFHLNLENTFLTTRAQSSHS